MVLSAANGKHFRYSRDVCGVLRERFFVEGGQILFDVMRHDERKTEG